MAKFIPCMNNNVHIIGDNWKLHINYIFVITGFLLLIQFKHLEDISNTGLPHSI